MWDQANHLDSYELFFDTKELRSIWYSYLLRFALPDAIPCLALSSV